MPGLSVRRIDEEVYEKLRSRAKSHGVSMEEEARRILRSAVSGPEELGSFALQLFGENGIELDIPARDYNEPVDFQE
mgnify:CR=1 FL=1